MSEDTGDPAVINVTNNFGPSQNGAGPLELSKVGKVKRFVRRHEVAITSVTFGAVMFGLGVGGVLARDKGQVTRLAEYAKNLRAELGEVDLDHQTAMEFIEFKKLRPQFEKFIAEKSPA